VVKEEVGMVVGSVCRVESCRRMGSHGQGPSGQWCCSPGRSGTADIKSIAEELQSQRPVEDPDLSNPLLHSLSSHLLLAVWHAKWLAKTGSATHPRLFPIHAELG
jgi:hypothetical protein